MAFARNLVSTKTFEKSYQRFTNKNQILKAAIAKALTKLEYDAFDPTLKTHKLGGKLAAYFACSCGYDCRIIFIVQKISGSDTEEILLLDIGTHDDVY
jgi:mRNA-degrading endonuclease YafQ of YafQ-DinJ toxin-antitoxin module